jgi:hypothetical protein
VSGGVLSVDTPHISAVYITPHSQNNLNFRYFMVNQILFYHSTVNFNQKLYGFWLCGVMVTHFITVVFLYQRNHPEDWWITGQNILETMLR